jgi:negative regulator of sigma-B (phosphoserine phosphatase)
MEEVKRRPLAWGVASKPRAGERESGDRCVVIEQANGALLAVADGLGHGAEAAVAAELAVRTVERAAAEPLIEIVKKCHQALLRTRGVALSLARWDSRDRVLTWIGIGNVEGLLLHPNGQGSPPSHGLILRGGVVGGRLPALLASPVAVEGKGLLVLATDGIAGAFDKGIDLSDQPEPLARRILARHARDNDDALALVARLEA